MLSGENSMYDELEKLTVEQLLNKQIEIKQKVAQAYSAGMSPAIIDQMNNLLEFIMIEIRTKAALEEVEAKRAKAIEEERDPDEDSVLNIGDIIE